MSMSTIPTNFPESAVQSSFPELSDELTAALAAGQWWAIMKVSSPLSNEPEYEDLTSVQWWGTMEAGETSCPTSLVFSDKSEKAESLHSGFSDATMKTIEHQRKWRQKEPQGPPVPAGSEKAKCGDSISTKQGRQQQGKWRQKKPQGPPVPAESDTARFSVVPDERLPSGNNCDDFGLKQGRQQQGKWRQKKPQVASEPARSPQGAPEHLCLPVPTVSSQDTSMVTKSLQREVVPAPKMLKIPEQLRKDLLQQKPQASSVLGGPIPNKTRERQKLKIPEPLRQELLQASHPAS
ncbi:hypothetical protein QQF64_023220 [Cirrhinus molitorella]|uniref:Uncharacterized protein n=1 Tax=Cirrhinus molitorella TaxID=172907 RepID=A0ABR3L862_9TELE